jgi:hypothetical protein
VGAGRRHRRRHRARHPHNPGNGVETCSIAEYLRTKRDPRIKYVISNKRIFSSVSSAGPGAPTPAAIRTARM